MRSPGFSTMVQMRARSVSDRRRVPTCPLRRPAASSACTSGVEAGPRDRTCDMVVSSMGVRLAGLPVGGKGIGTAPDDGAEGLAEAGQHGTEQAFAQRVVVRRRLDL